MSDALPAQPMISLRALAQHALYFAERLTKAIAETPQRGDASSIGGLAMIVLDVPRVCMSTVVRDNETMIVICAVMQRE